MPDLFLGAAAGPPGLPDWIDHAFPVPVKNDPAYLATAVAALGALFFQDIMTLPRPPRQGRPLTRQMRRLRRRRQLQRRQPQLGPLPTTFRRSGSRLPLCPLSQRL